MSQTEAILNYLNASLCKDGLLQSDDALKVYNANCIVALWLEDFIFKYVTKAHFGPDSEKAKAFEDILKVHLPRVLEHFNRKMPDTKFLLGDRISLQDIKLGGSLGAMAVEIEDDPMKDFKSAFRAQVLA